ncbi:MAG: cell division protein FtsL [Deltaproteobacteria bacterium]|nr:cell division protein FtsL [Deltaproteobacteria bacterium]
MSEAALHLTPRSSLLARQRVRERGGARRACWLLAVAGASALILAALLFYVWTRIRVVQMGYEISRANQAQRELLERSRALRLEVATLRAPRRIEAIAGSQLGLRPPRGEQVVVME